MVVNPIDLLSLALLIFTAVLSYRSYKFQLRASVRETLAQFDDREVDRKDPDQSLKVKAKLHRFEFGPSHVFMTWINRIQPLRKNSLTKGQERSRLSNEMTAWLDKRLDSAAAEVEILFRFYEVGNYSATANKGTPSTRRRFWAELQDIPEVIEKEDGVTEVNVNDDGNEILVQCSALDSPSVNRIIAKTFDSIDEAKEKYHRR